MQNRLNNALLHGYEYRDTAMGHPTGLRPIIDMKELHMQMNKLERNYLSDLLEIKKQLNDLEDKINSLWFAPGNPGYEKANQEFKLVQKDLKVYPVYDQNNNH